MTASSPAFMLGFTLPDVASWSERVVVALGQNPGMFTGPGTNTYLVGTGPERILLDTGDGRPEYLPILAQALEHAGGVRIQEIVLTHGHPDHIGGAPTIVEAYGTLRISKRPWAEMDDRHAVEIRPIDDGDIVHTEGATLRAVHTPGHAEDHLCFVLEEEGALFSGDNVLGIGTTVIPPFGGDLGVYMRSLDRLLAEQPTAIYPAHGPKIEDGRAKLREYIEHRQERERQVLDALDAGLISIEAIVKRIYAAYPEALHSAAAWTVANQLLKLEGEGRAHRDGEEPLTAHWRRA